MSAGPVRQWLVEERGCDARHTRRPGPDAAPAALRREVLAALSGADPARDPAGLLDPPGLPEIRSALAVLDADALVYRRVLVVAPGPYGTLPLPVTGDAVFVANLG